MKSYRQFISESVNIAGDFNGNLYINGSENSSEPVGESFLADVVWEGKLYRMELTSDYLPSRESLGEEIQSDYPGAIVHNIYPSNRTSNSALRITGIKRYQPERLTWTKE